jgi:DNA-directed RNA polymerase specialized sigma24 family protein
MLGVGEVVEERTVQKAGPKRDWVPTQTAFHRLLVWLDEETDSGGQRYLEMRRRLVLYFDRKNCRSPDELADETLNRVTRRLQEEGAIITDAPAHYCYIVARFVLLESLRDLQCEEPLDNRASLAPDLRSREDESEKERQIECLERCMTKLEPANRDLIVNYYQGEQRIKIENRRAMAARLGVSMNALSIRACRIRDRLEACMGTCLSGG